MSDFNPDDIRSMMDYVDEADMGNTEEVLLKFVENCIFLESQSHHWHLQCNNYAKHMEFNEFYQELPEYVDRFIEGLMSSRGPILCSGCSYSFQTMDLAIQVLHDFKQQCTAIHGVLSDEDEFGSVNTLEDLMSFIDGILYKLEVLA